MRHEYRFRIYSTDATSVESTFQSLVAGVPVLGGAAVGLIDGVLESQAWQVEVVDASTAVTSILSGADGRLDLLGRVADVQRRDDSDASTDWTTIQTGRITDIALSPEVASYLFFMQDERVVERRTMLFQHVPTSVHLLPNVRVLPYGPFQLSPSRQTYSGLMLQDEQLLANGNYAYTAGFFPTTVGEDVFGALPGVLLSGVPNAVIDAIVADVRRQDFVLGSLGAVGSSAGNFTSLRLYLSVSSSEGGVEFADRECVIEQFVPDYWGDAVSALRTATAAYVRFQTTAAITTFSAISTDTPAKGYLAFSSGPASRANPLYIEGHVGQIIADVYAGTYSTGGALRYSTAAIDTLTNNRILPTVRMRVVEPMLMADFLDDYIYRPFLIAPLTNASGDLAPTYIGLPTAAEVPDTTSLYAFTAASLAAPHPEWFHTAREQVTVIRSHWAQETDVANSTALIKERDGDALRVVERISEVVHDRASQLGIKVLDVGLGQIVPPPLANDPRLAQIIAEVYAQQWFDRYGDGPVVGTVQGLSAAESVEVGDFVTIQLDTFPNPGIQGRGGTRLVQITRKLLTPEGPVFSWLDAGPNSNPLTAPTVSLAASTASPLYHMVATIGSIPSSAYAAVQVIASTAATVPSTASTGWTLASTQVDSTGPIFVGPLASGRSYWARVQSKAGRRIGSTWATSTASVTLNTLEAVTALTASNVNRGTALLTWTVSTANPDNPVEVLLDENVALDTFTTAAGTALSAHTPDFGFAAWNGPASTVLLCSSDNTAYNPTSGGLSSAPEEGFVRSSGDIAHDAFTLFADFYRAAPVTATEVDPAITQEMGLVFRADNSTGTTGGHQRLLWEEVDSSTVRLRLETIASGSVVEDSTVSTALVLEEGGSLRLGINVDGTELAAWTEPAGGGARTEYTAVGSTYYNTTAYQRMGLWAVLYSTNAVDTLTAGGEVTTDSLASVTVLPPGSQRFQLFALSTVRSYVAGVRHRDPFPLVGVGTLATYTFAPTTSVETAPAMIGAGVVAGTTS